MNEIKIDSLTIHELRALARSLNIKSPSSKNRAELLDLIKLANNNKLPLEQTASNKLRGRPVKSNVAINYTNAKPLLEEISVDIKQITDLVNSLYEKIKKCIE